MTKASPLIVKYGRELKIEGDIRRKGKIKKAMEFVERIKKNTRRNRDSTKESVREYEKANR